MYSPEVDLDLSVCTRLCFASRCWLLVNVRQSARGWFYPKRNQGLIPFASHFDDGPVNRQDRFALQPIANSAFFRSIPLTYFAAKSPLVPPGQILQLTQCIFVFLQSNLRLLTNTLSTTIQSLSPFRENVILFPKFSNVYTFYSYYLNCQYTHLPSVNIKNVESLPFIKLPLMLQLNVDSLSNSIKCFYALSMFALQYPIIISIYTSHS